MIAFELAKKVAIDTYKLADDLRHLNPFFSQFGKSGFDVLSPPYVEKHYFLWKAVPLDEFSFDNLESILLIAYPDALPCNTSRILKNLEEGGNYLIEYPLGAIAAFYFYKDRQDFIETLSRDTGIPEYLCANIWPITKKQPYSMLPCGTEETLIKFRDRDIFSNLIAYAKIINDLAEFKDKRLIFFGGKPHALFFINNIKKLYPSFPLEIVRFNDCTSLLY